MNWFRSRSRKLLIAGTVAVTLACVFLAVNMFGGEKKIERSIERLYALEDPLFVRQLGVLLGPEFVDGNQVTLLRNGDQIFPAMLDAIRAARVSITFETYIYWSGDIGRKFAGALAERARSGVKVHVLLDWVGSEKIAEGLIEEMQSAGVQIERFHPPHWSTIGRMNNRTHRKLLVVDGRIGFTGGVGIAPQWTGNGQDPEHWRDSHFRLLGPAVAQMQATFLDNWTKVTGVLLHGLDYFPQLASAGNVRAQMFSSSPTGGSESMQLMYLMAITSASTTLDLSAAYFVPDDLSLKALIAALKRGVRLRIIVPGEHIDSDIVRSASRAQWGPLLEAGALIAEYAPTMYHCKVMIVDKLLVSVGSTNFDNRSFRLNDEATLNVLSAEFAEEQTRVFESDLALARPVSHAQWLQRPWTERVTERLASALRSQL